MSEPLFNVHQPGLIRGAERLAYAPHKRYFYVQHPTEGWKVFLRACCFIHEAGNTDINRFLVVKRYGATDSSKSWEPPKGQMEGKDGLAHPTWSVLDLLTENVGREVEEEAKIRRFEMVQYTGLVVQGVEKDYPENTYFQYHIFRAIVSPIELQNARAEFEWLLAHPKYFERLRKDKREKDAISWYNPRTTKLMGKWSPSIVILYLSHYSK